MGTTRELLLVSVLTAGVACSSDDPAPGEDIVSVELGPSGGSIEARCGTLEIPADALSGSTTVTIESLELALQAPLEVKGSFCRIDLGGAELRAPATLTLAYDAAKLPAGEIPETLIAVVQQIGETSWRPAWMPLLPKGGSMPVRIAQAGIYGPILALATNKVCAANISYCAALTGPVPAKTAPPSWTPIPGSGNGRYELDSLFKFYDDPGYVSEGVCMASLACFADDLSPQTLLAIMVQCKRLPCPYDLMCAARLVNAELSKNVDNVCRHYAWAMREAAALLGYSANFECGWDGTVGHAWVKVECGGRTYLLDAFAQTYVSMNGPVPPLCGNEVQETGEQCDGDPAVCSAPSECTGCRCVPLCGNGRLDTDEQCDSASGCPAGQRCDGCRCVVPPPECGNGAVEPGEQCENDQGCDSGYECVSCQCAPRCGNGRLDGVEECDGVANACGASEECVNCQCLPLCGNGVVDTGEECEGSGPAECTVMGEECYICQCVPFAQCAGIADAGMCFACCEGAATSQAEFDLCAAAHCM